MVCKNIKCSKEHNGSYGKGEFCSRSCANSRNWTKEDKLKKSTSAKLSDKVKIRSVVSLEKLKSAAITKSKIAKDKILTEDFNTLSWERLRKRVIWEQSCCCSECGLSEWRSKPIALEIDHKDGNNKNNVRENVTALCPNCHSLTNTWRGRNKSKKIKKISDEELLETLIKHNWNMRQSLIELRLAPKGGNYNRCHRLKRIAFIS